MLSKKIFMFPLITNMGIYLVNPFPPTDEFEIILEKKWQKSMKSKVKVLNQIENIEGEKLLMMSNFSFSQNVVKYRLMHRHPYEGKD